MALTRRGFLGAVLAGTASLTLAMLAPLVTPPPSRAKFLAVSGERILTYQGVPVHYDATCPPNTVYLIPASRIWWTPA